MEPSSVVSTTRRLRATRRALLAVMLLGAAFAAAPGASAAPPVKPEGTLTYGVHISLAPTWFEPAETSGIITPFMVLYALHDAVLKPMPGNPLAPSLAESWSVSEDGLIYEFVLRQGATFHDGSPVTAEDVKFSFQRYRGTAHDQLQARVAAVETPDAHHVLFKLKEPWSDFPTFYATATGAGWVVPKTYIERVGDEGFKKAPIGAGPYKFVSFTPGVELVLEAHEGYWRKTPSVKRLVFKVIPDEATRLAALKGHEVDIAYSIRGELADELETTPGLTLKGTVLQAAYWLQFPEQWDAKSPWHDIRVRQAVSLAIDRKTISEALTKGVSLVTSSIIPDSFEYYWKPPEPVYDRAKAKKLLAEAGYPNGFDGGDYYCDAAYANLAEAVINDLQAVGIKATLRPLERVAFYKSYAEKKLKNIIQSSSGAFGNAATRLEAFVVKGGTYVYGDEPDLDALFAKQATQIERKDREATLHEMQKMVYERALFTPIWQLGFLNGVGPRVAESGIGLINRYPYSAPYEELALKK